MKSKIWVGLIAYKPNVVFRSVTTPTQESHGEEYAAVIGPFRTVRGAAWMAHKIRGQQNPHCRTVADAERLAKKYAKVGGYDPKTQTWSDPTLDESSQVELMEKAA